MSACLGLLLWGVVLQLLLAEGDQGTRLARLARERLGQRRSLDLIRDDMRRARRHVPGAAVESSPCPLAGRRPVLQLHGDAGVVTYSVGPPPSPIWRGAVLLRCGPAFGLYGEPGTGDPQNRVLLDGLSATGLHALPEGEGILRLRLEQSLALPGGGRQRIASELTVPLPHSVALPPGH